MTERSSTSKTTTLADVAREVGVSTMTVSNVLNGRYKSSSHREAILAAVERLNFQLDPHAQRLASGFSRRTIALFSLSLDLGVATLKMHAIQRRLSSCGYDVPLHVYDYHSVDAPGRQVALIREICRQRPRAIVLSNESMSEAVFDELRTYQDSGGLVIAYDHPVELECDHVVFDRQENTYIATKAMLEQGHRSIGFANHGFEINRERFQGYARALGEYGLEVRDDWVFHGHYNYEEWGAHLAEEFLSLAQRPSGMVIVNDASASAFVQSLMRQGWRIPEDVSVVGHDDIAPGRYCIVPLTTVSHPVDEIAAAVHQLLAERLDGTYSGEFRQIIVRGHLVERASLMAAMRTF